MGRPSQRSFIDCWDPRTFPISPFRFIVEETRACNQAARIGRSEGRVLEALGSPAQRLFFDPNNTIQWADLPSAVL